MGNIIKTMIGKESPQGQNPATLVQGTCANPDCGQEVFEALAILDDAFAVWWGKCPFCGALNGLDIRGNKQRGYDAGQMHLCLPTEEEIIMNDLPAEAPTRGWFREANRGKNREELQTIYR